MEIVVTRDGYFDCGILPPCHRWDTADISPLEDSIFASHFRHIRIKGWSRGDTCYFGFTDTQNLQRRKNKTFGMLLDLDKGILTGYINGQQNFSVGNLVGPYCWVVGITGQLQGRDRMGAVKIRRVEYLSLLKIYQGFVFDGRGIWQV